MLCAVVAARTDAEARAGLQAARSGGAELAELRADFLTRPDLGAILADRPLPVMLTVRPKWEGGRFEGDEEARMALVRRGAELGVEFLDLEYRSYKAVAAPSSRLVVSLHDFEKVPADLEKWIDRMLELEPWMAKVAVTPRSTAELLELVELQERRGAKVAVIPMGSYAEPLRALYPSWSGPLMYASLEEAVAPGQISLREHREVYRTHEVGWETRRVAVVGDPVAHSRSPLLHNPWFARDGIDARMVRVRLDQGEALRATMERLGLSACAVTVPHKEAAARQLDEAPPALGAVNTVWFEGKKLRGANTDLDGARAAIAGAAGPALVYGAGGTARAYVTVLKEAGHEVWVTNRTKEKAERLAAELGVRAGDAVEARTIVNTTSVGMSPNEDASVVPPEMLGPGVTAIDAVYTPPETRFLREARARGARAISGTVMFEAQAKAQYEIFKLALRG